MRPHYANRKNLKARYLGTLKGKRVFEFPVEATIGEQAALTQENIYPKFRVDVIAHKAADAADLVAGDLGRFACVEISVWGPKCGLAAKRFWGWERSIWNQLASLDRKQITLKFDERKTR